MASSRAIQDLNASFEIAFFVQNKELIPLSMAFAKSIPHHKLRLSHEFVLLFLVYLHYLKNKRFPRHWTFRSEEVTCEIKFAKFEALPIKGNMFFLCNQGS